MSWPRTSGVCVVSQEQWWALKSLRIYILGRELRCFSRIWKLGGVDESGWMYMFMKLRSCLWMRVRVAWSSRLFVGSLGRAVVISAVVLVVCICAHLCRNCIFVFT